MFSWFDQYKEASPQTKYFIFNCAIYSIAIIITTVYCYARLDFVRSTKKETQQVQQKENKRVGKNSHHDSSQSRLSHT